MSSEQITSMSPETVESKIDSIYEKMKNPDIQLMVENQISELTQSLPEFKWNTSKEIYERFWWEYSSTPEELAKVFSYIFRKVRDWIEIKDKYIQVNLQNPNSTLSIHQDGDINNIVWSLKHWITIRSLENTVELEWNNFIKIEFFGSDGSVKTGYISENYTKATDTKSLKQLNWYIRSIWLNPTKELKKDIFQKVYFLKDYNENKTRDNNEVYHKLVQDYELRKLIELEECRLACLADLEKLNDIEIDKLNLEQHIYPEWIISEFGYEKEWLTAKDIVNQSSLEKSKLQQEIDTQKFIDDYIPDFLKPSADSSETKFTIPFRNPDYTEIKEKINPDNEIIAVEKSSDIISIETVETDIKAEEKNKILKKESFNFDIRKTKKNTRSFV